MRFFALILASLFFVGVTVPITSAQASESSCISLVGDSVAYGTVVYVVPGHGFGVLRLKPLSVVLEETFAGADLEIEIRDRTASAAFLSDDGKFPYSEMEIYDELLEDKCEWVIVMPWINDMSIERDNSAQAHIEVLDDFLQTLQEANPASKILLVGYYYGQPSEFATLHAAGYTDEGVTEFNERLFAACESDFVDFETLFCLPVAQLFENLNNAHVVLSVSQSALDNALYEPIPEDVAPLFEVYFRDNPEGLVEGDGVHLNTIGKTILSQAILDALLELDSSLNDF